MSNNSTPAPNEASGYAGIVERTIEALLERQRQQKREQGVQTNLSNCITRFAVSMRFVYIHLVIFGLWIAVNLGWLPIKPFDPSSTVLAMVTSVEAIFISTFVLISQNRSAELANKRAELDLQISPLAEHETTRLIAMVSKIAERMGIDEANDPELAGLSTDVRPENVLGQMVQNEREAKASNQSSSSITECTMSNSIWASMGMVLTLVCPATFAVKRRTSA